MSKTMAVTPQTFIIHHVNKLKNCLLISRTRIQVRVSRDLSGVVYVTKPEASFSEAGSLCGEVKIHPYL